MKTHKENTPAAAAVTNTVTLIEGWWVDSRGNRWDCDEYNEEKAAEYSATLTNCSWCRDCIYCVDCSDCTNCIYCADCSDCTNCCGCQECSDCIDCAFCHHCVDCEDCGNCTDGFGWKESM